MPAPHRIIDANANRAREALRTLEDCVRFALDDAGLSAELKEIRHDFQAAIESTFDAGLLLAWRDTEGDVGTTITTEGESNRTGMRGVVLAAGSRLSESLRSIEEQAKALGVEPGAFERLRYRSYETAKRVALAFGSWGSPQWTLCVVLTGSLCEHHSWQRVAQLAIEGGADCIQLREKDLDDAELLARARRLREITCGGPGGAALVINDRPDIAVLCGADGVHLGQNDMSVADARKVVGFDLLVGVSTSNMEQARRAVRDGADYCGCGPMFASGTKPKDTLAGPEYLAEYLVDPVTAARPHLAISGIGPNNMSDLLAVGCRGVAISGAVCGAESPGQACSSIVDAMQSPASA